MSAKKNHLKRNTTVAGLAALLAVSALGSNNISSHIHLPSITANASTNYNTGYGEGIANLGGHAKTPEQHLGNNEIARSFNGNTYEENTKTGQDTINGVPVSSHEAFNDINNGTGPSTQNTSNSSNNNPSNNGDSDNSNQYSSSSLPQTGESNTGSKAGIAGIALLASSFGLAKLSKAKRNKNIHDAIIGSTFKDIGSSLK